MKITYSKFDSIVTDVLQSALAISLEAEVEEGCPAEKATEASFSMEVELDDTDLELFPVPVRFFFDLEGDDAVVHAFVGCGCSDLEAAGEASDDYNVKGSFSDVWSIPCYPDDSGVMLTTQFSVSNEHQLKEQLLLRLSLFTNPRFAEDLRPILQYYQD